VDVRYYHYLFSKRGSLSEALGIEEEELPTDEGCEPLAVGGIRGDCGRYSGCNLHGLEVPLIVSFPVSLPEILRTFSGTGNFVLQCGGTYR